MTPIRPSHSQDELIVDMNVTPMVDVMLVLLVIFMITAPLMFRYQTLTLPQEALAQTVPDASPVTLSITADGSLFLDGEAVTEDAFRTRLATFATSPDFPGIRVAADDALPYGRMLHVMHLMQNSGVDKITVIAALGQ